MFSEEVGEGGASVCTQGVQRRGAALLVESGIKPGLDSSADGIRPLADYGYGLISKVKLSLCFLYYI